MAALLVDDRDGVRTLTLNRPEAFNSLTVELKELLLAALTDAAAATDVRAVVLTGAGKAFCAGQDLKEHVAALRSNDPAPFRTVAEHYNPIVRALTGMPKPVIAAVNGMAAGAGASFAYACDLRVAGESTKFLMAFATIGLTADSGASWTLPRLIGYGRAMEMMLLAKPVTADRALELGMVTSVVPDADVLSTARRTGLPHGGRPDHRLRQDQGSPADGARAPTWRRRWQCEGAGQTVLGATTDHREAVDAFVEKRTPTFTGH